MEAVTPEAGLNARATGERPRELGIELQRGTSSTANEDLGWTDDPEESDFTCISGYSTMLRSCTVLQVVSTTA